MTRSIPLLAAVLASCGAPAEPNISVADGWARETVAGQTSTAAYLAVSNTGAGHDKLVAVTMPVPARASLHTTIHEDGIAKMRSLEYGLDIPARKTVTLRPGGAHVMVEDLGETLRAGETLRMTLRFSRSGAIPVEIAVRPAGTTGPADQAH